jgi:hypothetical protein
VFFNPSLKELAKIWKVEIISTEVLKRENVVTFARQILEEARKTFDARSSVSKDIPAVKELAIMGFSAKRLWQMEKLRE